MKWQFVFLVFWLALVSNRQAVAQNPPYFWDEFDRTELSGEVTWNTFRSGDATLDGDSVSFVPTAVDFPGFFPGLPEISDSTVRTRVHFHDPTPSFQINPWIGIYLRNVAEFVSYWAGPSADGFLYIGESGGPNDIQIRSSRHLFTSEQILRDDIDIEIRAIGDTITASAWIAGTARPESPTLTMQDDSLEKGTLGCILNPSSYLTGFDVRYFAVLPAITGDFNGNGLLDVDDVDLMAVEVRTGSTNRVYDLNEDAAIDTVDFQTWVKDTAHLYYGDANLDGEFNSNDLVNVFGFGIYETGGVASWSSGDWNGDGYFNSADFVLAFEDGGYEQGPRAVAAVPEPTATPLWTLLLAGMGVRAQRKTRNGAIST